MMTWLTRMSFLDTAEDLETDLLVGQMRDAAELAEAILFQENEELTMAHPVVRIWAGYEIGLIGYLLSMNLELARRGIGSPVSVFKITGAIQQLRSAGEDTTFVKPAWTEDTDVLRSHRSNMVRRWPQYASVWSKTPELMPYIWPFVDADGSYHLMLSKHDKELLASGERTLPPTIKKRIENL